nr:PREDICTED: gastrula zinc finger protein XlCGF57.1-like isoform X2 [Bemisia tabaci]
MSETSGTSIVNIKMEPGIDGTGEKNFDLNNVTDLSQTCRACACVDTYFIPVFDGQGIEHDLGAKINQYLPIIVSKADELPTQLCYQCASLLVTWHEMFIGSLKAEENLRKLKLRLNAKNAYNVDDEGRGAESEELDSNPEFILGTEMEEEISRPLIVSAQPISKKKSEESVQNNHSDSDDSKDFQALYGINSERCTLNLSEIDVSDDSDFHLCQACGNVYKYFEEFEVHNKQEHDSTAKCMKVLAPIGETKSNKIENTITCLDCGLIVPSKKHLRFHIHSAHPTKDEEEMERVLKDHDLQPKKKGFECNQCHRKNYHQHLPDGQILKKYECEICQKAFATKSEYQTHALTHSKEKPFMCDLCGKRFKVKNSLSNHVKYTHVRQRKFVCMYCGWTACRRYNLDVHIRRHTGQKPFACSVCGRRFTQKNDMLKHQTRHEGEGKVLDDSMMET